MRKPHVFTLKTYSRPHIEWPGFDGRGYKLDAKKVGDLTVSMGPKGAPFSEYKPTTVGDIYHRFPETVKMKDDILLSSLTTDEGEFGIRGPGFAAALLAIILELRTKGHSAFYSTWNYYDDDHVTDDIHRSFSFFITSGDKILMDRVNVSDADGMEFDPTIFLPAENDQPIWRNSTFLDRALVKANYVKFYTETLIGRLMVLREDEPRLFYMPSRRSMDEAIAAIETRLERVRTLVGWLLFIAAVDLAIRLWR